MSATFDELTAAAKGAGFSDADALTAAAIALAESGGNARAVSPTNTNGTRDHGAWQINSVHSAILATGDRYNLNDNASMAYQVFRKQGFAAWTTYKNGAYRRFLPASTPAATPAAPSSPLDRARDFVTGTVSNVTGLDKLANTMEKFASTYVGTLIGITLVVVAVVILVRNTDAAKTATAAATTAVKVAAPTPGGKAGAVAKVAKVIA